MYSNHIIIIIKKPPGLIEFCELSLNAKGPVSGFVGRIPLPSLESSINRNH